MLLVCVSGYALIRLQYAMQHPELSPRGGFGQDLEATRISLALAVTLSSVAVLMAAYVLRRAGYAESTRPAPSPPAPVAPNLFSGRLLSIQEEERKNLSRELHDGIGQTITALKMELSRVKSVEGSADAERLERSRRLAEEVLRTIRNICVLLRPTALDDLGLEAALRWHVEDFSRRTSIYCELACSLPNERALSETVKTCVYRVVQEALNNCEKHAAPTRILLTVKQTPETVDVSINDDGVGFHVGSAGLGLGILGMRERASIVGGAFQIQSTPGTGTMVVLSVPLSEASSQKGTERDFRRA